jgi:hypothetical protein
LYRLTGCLDLALSEGQKKHRLPQAGTTRLDITPILSPNEIQTPSSSTKSNTRKKKKNQNSVHSNSNQIHCQQSAKNSLTHIAKTNQIHILVTQSTKF